jgi:hypothetical protein
MTFTDDDLKRLKEQRVIVHEGIHVAVKKVELQALLARLEAAERVIAKHFELMNISTFEELQAWRKAAGK